MGTYHPQGCITSSGLSSPGCIVGITNVLNIHPSGMLSKFLFIQILEQLTESILGIIHKYETTFPSSIFKNKPSSDPILISLLEQIVQSQEDQRHFVREMSNRQNILLESLNDVVMRQDKISLDLKQMFYKDNNSWYYSHLSTTLQYLQIINV
uniref:Uncharacterized protein n=1 Tax=Laminaria rodriguezii TaxID=1740620 RepID=A0A7U1G3P0_9PHAE|nr:hypothetical protein K4Y99_mgp02 [Laminaria rodriguezii]QQY84997.1 hypothetical protein [Laminaria rodriguezii]